MSGQTPPPPAPAHDRQPAGSVVLGLLLAMVMLVTGLFVGVVSAMRLADTWAVAICAEPGEPAKGLRDDCDDAERHRSPIFESIAAHYLSLATIVLMSPALVLLVVGRWLRRRGRRRTRRGFAAGAVFGAVVFCGAGVNALFESGLWRIG